MPRSERWVARSPRGRGTPEPPFLSRAGGTPHPATDLRGSSSVTRHGPARCLPGSVGVAAHLGAAGTAAALQPAATRRCHLLLAFGGRCPLSPSPRIAATAARTVATDPDRSQSGKILRQRTRRPPTRPRLRRPLSPAAPLGAPAAARTLSSATDRPPAARPHTAGGDSGHAPREHTRMGGTLDFPPLFLMLLPYGIGGCGSQIPRLLPSERVSTPFPQPPPLDSLSICRCLRGIPTPSPLALTDTGGSPARAEEGASPVALADRCRARWHGTAGAPRRQQR